MSRRFRVANPPGERDVAGLRKHTFSACENIAQAFMLVLTIIGGGIGMDAVRDDKVMDSKDKNSYYFVFFFSFIICASLLLNASRRTPPMAPIMMGMAWFWFPMAVRACDTWNRAKSVGNNERALTGMVICCIAVGLAALFESSFPTCDSISEFKPMIILSIIIFLTVLGCLLGIAIELDDSHPFHGELMDIGVQSVVSAFFVADSILMPDLSISYCSLFMGSISASNLFFYGVKEGEASGSEKTVYECSIVASLGLVAITTMSLLSHIYYHRELLVQNAQSTEERV